MSRPDHEAALAEAREIDKGMPTGWAPICNLARAYLALSRRVEELQRVLKQAYMAHAYECPDAGLSWMIEPGPCTCGLSTALSEASQNE